MSCAAAYATPITNMGATSTIDPAPEAGRRSMGPSRRTSIAGLASTLVMLSLAKAAGQPVAAPPHLTRADWGAKPPLPGMRPQRPSAIIVHHTAEPQKPHVGMPAKLRGLQAFSQQAARLASGAAKPAWPDVPYHFYIGADGVIAEGRDVNFAGDTNTGYDTTGYIQMVLEGNFEIEQPTARQFTALKQALIWQMAMWRIPVARISTHKDHARTACPGRALIAAMPQILAEVGASRRG
jgi:N-acetylmuramoyl-L-alanine amidase